MKDKSRALVKVLGIVCLVAAMVCAGLSAVSAIWKTIWMRRNCSRVRWARWGGSGLPSKRIWPSAGGTSPAIARASVVLPDPDSPITPSA